MTELSETYNGRTGEQVILVRRLCKCGHSLTYLTNKPKICRNCGRLVYPSKECEFKEKMQMKLRKELSKSNEQSMVKSKFN